MAYFYAVLWALTGLILIFRMGGENRVFYPIGAFFLLLGVWWAAGQYMGQDLFSGGWGWALRAVTAAALALAVAAYVRETRKNRGKHGGKDDGENDGE